MQLFPITKRDPLHLYFSTHIWGPGLDVVKTNRIAPIFVHCSLGSEIEIEREFEPLLDFCKVQCGVVLIEFKHLEFVILRFDVGESRENVRTYCTFLSFEDLLLVLVVSF
jgi:hypothetical protein